MYVFQGKEDAERDKGIRPKLRRRVERIAFFFFFFSVILLEVRPSGTRLPACSFLMNSV